MKRAASPWLFIAVLLCPLSAQAELPAFLRIENSEIRDGNEKLQKGDAKGALAAYDKAARQLPDAPGVQLDRGLALLKMGQMPKAREALLSATAPSASTDVRADAYENLALSYYREAETLARDQKHEEAQRQFREAADAAKRSLRLRPSDPNAAWNLELATRRIREEEQKQKQQDDKKKQDDKNKDQDKQKQDQQQQNQDQKPDDKKQQDQQPQDQQKNDQSKNDDKKGDDKKQQDQQGKQDKQDKSEAQKQAEKDAAQKAKQDQQAQSAQAKQDQKPPDSAQKPVPAEVENALDALQHGEENFERVRARQRASQERRAPEKDW